MHIWKLLVSLDIDIIIILVDPLSSPQRHYTSLPKKSKGIVKQGTPVKPQHFPLPSIEGGNV
jgi:hypothetical protein